MTVALTEPGCHRHVPAACFVDRAISIPFPFHDLTVFPSCGADGLGSNVDALAIPQNRDAVMQRHSHCVGLRSREHSCV